jgi:hypothetical protein
MTRLHRGVILLTLLALGSVESPAAIVEYQVTGKLVKDPSSDRLFNSNRDSIEYDVRFTADTDLAARVPAGTQTSLPNFSTVKLPEDGFLLPAAALKSFSFRAAGGDAKFDLKDVIVDETTGASIFLTGSLSHPTGISMLLANGISGYLQVGLLHCTRGCKLSGGIVLDRAGPFGVIDGTTVASRVVASPGN